jgi:hypothetical protein
MRSRATRFVEEYLQARESRSAAGSATGYQLDGIRDNTLGSAINVSARENKNIRFSMLAILWGTLTSDEQTVLTLQHTPASQVLVQRTVKDKELIDHPTLGKITNDGKIPIVCNEDGTWLVEGFESRFLNYEEIAHKTGYSYSQVNRRTKLANRKILNHPLYNALYKDHSDD